MEIIAVGPKQLQRIRGALRDTGRVFVTITQTNITARVRQLRGRNIVLVAVLNVAPLHEWYQRHRVVAVRHAPERGRRESTVEELSERGVAESRFAERCDGGGPTAAGKVEAGERGDSPAERVTDERQCILGVLFDEVGNNVGDSEVSLAPALEEARVHEAAGALVSGSVMAFRRVRDVLLLSEGEVGERVSDGVGPTECDDDAGNGRRVGEGYVTAGVGEGEAGIPGLFGGGLV